MGELIGTWVAIRMNTVIMISLISLQILVFY